MKRLIALLLAAAMLLSLAGCSAGGSNTSGTKGNASGETAADGGEKTGAEGNLNGEGSTLVTMGVSADPATLAPWEATSDGRENIVYSIYQQLFANRNGELVPVIGESYEHIDDTHTVVTIYDNVTDSKGNHITASDVAFSYNKAMEAATNSYLYYMESCEATGDYTVEFTWTEEYANVLNCFEEIVHYIFIVSEAEYLASSDGFSTYPVGTAHYAVTDYVPGSYVLTEKVEDYWQDENSESYHWFQANVDAVKYLVITDKSQLAMALETGTIDYAMNLNNADLPQFEEGGKLSDRYNVTQLQNASYILIANCADEVETSNVNLRKAIFYCFDASQVIAGPLDNRADLAYSPGGNATYTDYNEDWEKEDYFGYNAELANSYLQAYLDETGKSKSDVTVRFLCSSAGNNKAILEVVQGYVLQLGIGCEIMAVDSATNKSIRSDPSAWEFRMIFDGSSTKCCPLVWGLNRNATTDGVRTSNYILDDTLQALVEAASNAKTHTQDTVNAEYDYIKEMAYERGIAVGYYNFVTASFITDFVMEEISGRIIPGSCTYDWSQR